MVLPDKLKMLTDAATRAGLSMVRFEDGGEYRVEIPSVESTAAFQRVIEECARLGVPLHRISQGSGITILTDAVMREYVTIGADANVEVCLFIGPRALWDGNSASALAPDGGIFGARHIGVRPLASAWADVERAVEAGIRSLLVADEGLLVVLGEARASGQLPPDLIVKASALMGIANPLGAELLARSGADCLNIASDTTLADLAGFRAATAAVLDIYIEGQDGLGGFMRYHDIGDIVRIAAPVHLKFGLRNTPSIYPAGQHLTQLVESSAIARVHRAKAGMEHLARCYPAAAASPVAASRAGIPVKR